MNKSISKLTAFLLAVVLVFAMSPALVLSADTIASGTCGKNLTWVLDDSGKLTISGSGNMDNYSRDNVPWGEYAEDIESVVFSGNVTSIGNEAFNSCLSLSSIELPDSLTSIGDYAFYCCYALTDIKIPDSVTSIGYGAFMYCQSIESLVIPNSVTSIGMEAFYSCESLYNIVLPNTLTVISDALFCECPSLESIEIPYGVTSIGGEAFYGCYSLESVTIPDSVTSIGALAFYECESLSSIRIPDGVTKIGYHTFYKCPGLKTIVLPVSVTEISIDAFIDEYSYNFPEADVYYAGTRAMFECIDDYAAFDPQYFTIHYDNTPVMITSQPKNYTGAAGSTASFSVTATGTGLTYQWQMYSNGAWKNSGASGSKTNKISFKVSNTHDGMMYRCVVTSSNGIIAISSPVTVKIGTPVTITQQPSDYSGAIGSTASFSVTAQGEGLTYQWQMYTNGAWKNSGATGSKTNKISFKVSNTHNGMKYRCIVKDKNGTTATTDEVSVKVVTPLAITKQPANYAGAVGSTASFSVTAQGEGLTYQWQMYTNGAWKNSGATGSKTNKISFKVSNSHNGMKYRCIVKDKNGKTVTSNAASVSVVNTLAITKQPVNYSGTVGSTATFSVTANGEGLTYQWQMYTNGAWKNSGATGSKTNKISFKVTSNHNGMKYRCIVTDKNGKKVYSNTAKVSVV
ncbi:MAG: leucine-rich repeat domain-containing protein [Clostridiales bacterium]|nr:leucine-rich repeat domain-containing protein [Clostridiales bacterium]MBR3248029.1 leucine-rich repeat domain-containing protein [Clostridiales bacterium]